MGCSPCRPLHVTAMANSETKTQPWHSDRIVRIQFADEAPNRVTILYDAFGKSAAMTKAWGFSALVEFGGKRILFDTGGNAEILEHNVKALGVDLSKLDFVVISHRHGDHIRA
jgi:glyoxylase-like metal-dependent hydrolase (beta-lactamase superfamily II)